MRSRIIIMLMSLLLVVESTAVRAQTHSRRSELPLAGATNGSSVLTPHSLTASFPTRAQSITWQVLLVTRAAAKVANISNNQDTITSPADMVLQQEGNAYLATAPTAHTILTYRYDQPYDRAAPGQQSAVAAPTTMLATCIVTKKDDSGAGTLRQCLLNAAPGGQIHFDPTVFPPGAPATILLASALPWITVNQLTIDGSNAGVILNGQSLATGGGLVISGATGVIVRGLQIINFPWDGIALIKGTTNTMIGGDRSQGTAPLGQGNLLSGNTNANLLVADSGTSNNQVLGNYIGVNVSGTQPANNGGHGIAIGLGATNTTVGGTKPAIGNVISGNRFTGILIRDQGVTGNHVLGNYIGTDKTGLMPLGNFDGILIGFGAQGNIIGGDTTGSSNLISGNQRSGVVVRNNTSNNRIVGNRIGTDAEGLAALGNTWGIVISDGAQNNLIGGNSAQERNLISGNRFGIQLQNVGTTGNQMLGNYIGVDLSGAKPIRNTIGVVIRDNASDNFIGSTQPGQGNIISGNETGIQFEDPGTRNNQILGNFIGVNVSGTVALSNVVGISIGLGASSNIVGGATNGARNLISGNAEAGVRFIDPGTTDNRVLGNYIGTDVTGTSSIGNFEGVLIMRGAQKNQVGGTSAGTRNLLSGNLDSGVAISGTTTISNVIIGNYIGTTASGNTPLQNNWGVVVYEGANRNVIGGESSGERNIISGNRYGVQLQGSSVSHNRVVGNYIGLDPSGMITVSNEVGIFIRSGANANIIGGTTANARNIISGNDAGITLQGIQGKVTENRIIGNYIGTNVAGSAALGNKLGIVVGPDADNNIIGGPSNAERNVISGNLDDGVRIQTEPNTPDSASGNQVIGNYIGVDATGVKPLGNLDGVVVGFGAQNNLIGGATAGLGNVISANHVGGVWLQDNGTTGNQIMGNYIGVDATGAVALANRDGIVISGAPGNRIGGNTPGQRNLISGNTEAGIHIQNAEAYSNVVQGNYIGTDLTGGVPLGNTIGIVVFLDAHDNLIGGEQANEGNLISGNRDSGITLQGAKTTGNKIWGNLIGTNAAGSARLGNDHGIVVFEGAHTNTVGIASDRSSGRRNLISGNSTAGVTLQGSDTQGNRVAGNFIGVDLTGMTGLGNRLGVSILDGAHDNVVGGPTPLERNLISSNSEAGIKLQNADTHSNHILGNDIGINVTGQARLPNEVGILLLDRAHNNQIGDATTGNANVISGNNQAGIHLRDEGTRKNTIAGNLIGTNLSVTLPVSNAIGILLEGGASENTIGASNTIFYNALAGIVVRSATSVRNTITRNSIYHNGNPPIDLNDVLDAPLPPELNTYTPPSLIIEGNTCPNCLVELFTNPAEGAGGMTFVTAVTATVSGNFSVTLSKPLPLTYLSATATKPDGTTSEFSRNVKVVGDGILTPKSYLPMLRK